MKFQKGNIEQLVIFSLSPFLSLPIVLYNLHKNNRFSQVLVSVLMGVVSFLYLPSYTNDKTRYLERFVNFKNLNLNQFFNYLIEIKKPDFIFDLLIFLFSSNGIRIHFLFFFLSFFIVYSVFFLTKKILPNYLDKLNLTTSIFILLSISLPSLFSGLRFALGGAIMLWGIYFLLYKKAFFIGGAILLLSVVTHFSMLFFVPAIFLVKYIKRFNYYRIFLFSLSFLFLSEIVFNGVLSSFSFIDSYSNKINDYTQEGDFITEGLNRSLANRLMYYIKISWIYIAYVFLLINKRYDKKDLITKILFIFLSFVNLTYSFPTIYSRYLSLVKIIFMIFILKQFFYKPIKNKKMYFLFYFLFLFAFLADLYKMRYNFQATFTQNLLTTVNILSHNFELSDILH